MDTGFRYQPALDGVRAIAVLAVLGFHFGVSFGEGGYLGVDVFLVLSGYLITSLLAIERSTTGRIDFLHFWGRRIRRLLPALLVLLAFVGLYAWLVAPDTQLARIRNDGLATLFYFQNWHLVVSDTGRTSPLSHTWSLAIEEQWYLIWPPVFLALTWLCRSRDWLLLGVVSALAVLSAWEMALLGPGGRAYFGTDTRAQSLLLGAALALLLQLRPGPVRTGARYALEGAGLLGIAVFLAMVANPPTRMDRGGFFVVAVATSCFIAASVQRKSPVIRPLLSFAPLRWVGLISYGVYLYHFVVLRWLNPARTGLSPIPLGLLRFAVTIVVAAISYRLIEMPVRRGTFLGPRAQVVVAPVAVALAIAIVVITTLGAPVAETLSRNERIWAYARETTPAEATRVLVVGDAEVLDLVLAMNGPFDERGVRGLGSASIRCAIEDLRPPPGQARSAECHARWKEIESVLRAYRPASIVIMAESPALTGEVDRVRAVARDIEALRPNAVVTVISPPATTSPGGPGAPERGLEGLLTREGGRAVWTWIVDDLPDRPGS